MSKRVVEDFLIEPLIAHFENEPTDGIRNTLIEDFEEAESDTLFATVEFLKRNLLTKKSFPAPRKINEAFKAVKYAPKIGSGNMGHINAENFTQLQAEYAAMNKGRIQTIEKGGIEWQWWQDYLRNHVGQFYLANLMEQYTKWGVVTRHPSEFDLSYSGAIQHLTPPQPQGEVA